MVKSWYDNRGMAFYEELLPSVGVLVTDVAAGWLYQTDSKIVYIENLISNPLIEPHIKEEALDLVAETLCMEAENLGFKFIVATTWIKAVANRAKKHGFTVDDKPYFHSFKEIK